MATNTAYNQLTILERIRRTDPSGDAMAIAEVLAEENPIFFDMPMFESNDAVSHKVNRRTAIPTGTWTKYYQGVATVATRTKELVFGIGNLKAYSEPDKDLIDSFPNPKKARMDEAMGIIEGMSQEVAATLVYGNAASAPEEFDGFATHMNTVSSTTNVISAGGSGSDTTSVFIVQWGPRKVYGVYPKGDPFYGIRHRDLGEHTQSTATTSAANTAQLQVYRDLFQIKLGLVIHDDRCIARIANIESTGSSNLIDEDDIIKVLNRMPNSGRGSTIYCNDTVLSQLEISLKNKTNVYYKPANGEGLVGEPVAWLRGNPVKQVDQILNTETAIS